MNLAPDVFYREQLDAIQPRPVTREALSALLGLPAPITEPPAVRVDEVREEPDFTETRYFYETEPGLWGVCHLAVPRAPHNGPWPVMVCVQGHFSGVNVSLGRVKWEGNEKLIENGEDYALWAVRHGFAALCVEQRCFGERAPVDCGAGLCYQASMQALLLGRTLVGDRVWDARRAMDTLARFDGLDLSRIAMMGHSGGGTATFFTACMDDRIRLIVSSGYVTCLKDSIFTLNHCTCNYIPGLLAHADLPEWAALLSPRPLIVVSGDADPIFPYDSARRAFARIAEIYAAAGAAESCVHVCGHGEHRFFAPQTWAAIDAFAAREGWIPSKTEEESL